MTFIIGIAIGFAIGSTLAGEYIGQKLNEYFTNNKKEK